MPFPAPSVRTPCPRTALATGCAALVRGASFALALCVAGPLSAQCELDKLKPAGALAEDRAGAAVALYGMDALVGRPGADLPGVGADAGSVAAYHYGDAGWAELPPLLAPQGAAGDRFGETTGMADDLAVVGAPGDDRGGPDAGAVYVFERFGAGWVLVATLIAPDAEPGANFGAALGVYTATLIVGAPHATAGGVGDAGAAYLYERHDGHWTLVRRVHSPLPQAGGDFGCSVSVEDLTAVAGARGEDDGAVPGAGAAYVFGLQGGVWLLAAALHAVNGHAGDEFGASVSNTGAAAAVGAPGADGAGVDVGAVTLFQKSSGTWALKKQFHAPVPGNGAEFGRRVGLFKGLLAVAAPAGTLSGSAAGEVHLFVGEFGIWNYALSLHASDAAQRDGFGLGLSLWDDSLLVGAPDDDDLGNSSGAAYIVQPFGVTFWGDLQVGGSGLPGAMELSASGELCSGGHVTASLHAAVPFAPVALIVGAAEADLPFHGGLLVPRPDLVLVGFATDGAGSLVVGSSLPTGVPAGTQFFLQAWVVDAAAPFGVEGSNGVLGLSP